MHRHLSRRPMAGALISTALVLSTALPASAHVAIIDGAAVVGGGFGTEITFRVPHGCDGAATDTLEVQVPEGVTSVKPKWMAGWTIETEPRGMAGASIAPAAPVDPAVSPAGHAEEAVDVGVVRWTGATLPDSQYLDFQLRAIFPETPGTIVFPTVQRCGDVEVAWIEIPAEGQSEDDLEHPAPAVTVVEGEADTH
jgi:uncharacterized protein YcnI